jgi:UrcA family protein
MVDGSKLKRGAKIMLNSKKSWVSSVSCVLFGLALYTPAAFAGLRDDPPSINVSYSTLDLSKPAAAETLYRRIRQAARSVCAESYRGMGPLRPYSDKKKCEATAIGKAVSDVNHPLLSALWQKQTRLAANR